MSHIDTASPSRRLLRAIGLHRAELRAWALYDFGISALQTTVMTSIFPIFFVKVAGAGLEGTGATQWWARANTCGSILIAVLAPLLGAMADYRAAKKRFLVGFMLLGTTATASMFFISEGQIVFAAIVFILALAGASGSTTFYESLLPHIADEQEIDRVSTAGYALGYVGGGLLLALNLAWIAMPGRFGLPAGEGLSAAQASLPTRLAFLSVAVWWLVFSIPLLRRVAEPARAVGADETAGASAFVVAFTRLVGTVRELRGYRQAFLAMLAFTIYNDGIQTIIKMAAVYGTEIGIGQSDLIAAILVVQFVGIPCAFLFGGLAGRLGTKRAILLGLAMYVGICIFGYTMTTALEFYILACLVGLVQGGTQALSRSLFARLVPKHKSGEFFGFYAVFEKFGGILGPLLFGVALGQSGSSRIAILSVLVFFVVGGAILCAVNVGQGEQAARDADLLASATQRPPVE